MTNRLAVPVTQLGPAFHWLQSYGVTSTTIGAAFKISAENVRVISSRRKAIGIDSESSSIVTVPSADEKQRMGIRPGFDETLSNKARVVALEDIRKKFEAAMDEARASSHFETGVSRLRTLLPMIGYPSDSRRVELLGQLHFRISWLLGHLGRSTAAIRHSALAMDLFRTVWHESGDRSVVDRFVLAGLVRSQSLLLSHQPDAALRVLTLIGDAAASVSSPLGSDHFRQRGVAALQLHEDSHAATMFKLSSIKMIELNEAKSPAQLLMTGDRHLNLLGTPKPDRLFELRQLATATFGPASLETSMVTHWAAAAAFSTGSSPLVGEAMDLLYENAATAAQFGHQATIATLLGAVPVLGLYGHLQRKFIRFALYENAFRFR